MQTADLRNSKKFPDTTALLGWVESFVCSEIDQKEKKRKNSLLFQQLKVGGELVIELFVNYNVSMDCYVVEESNELK